MNLRNTIVASVVAMAAGLGAATAVSADTIKIGDINSHLNPICIDKWGSRVKR